MLRSMKSFGIAAVGLVASVMPALAQNRELDTWWWWNPRPVTNVPEIDASSGLLALAAVAALLAFVVERRRRA